MHRYTKTPIHTHLTHQHCILCSSLGHNVTARMEKNGVENITLAQRVSNSNSARTCLRLQGEAIEQHYGSRVRNEETKKIDAIIRCHANHAVLHVAVRKLA